MNFQCSTQKTELPVEFLEKMSSMLRILAHPHRLKIVEYLEAHESAPVHEIMLFINLPQAAVSQHLVQMKRIGLLHCERRGRESWYSIKDNRCLSILNCIRGRASQSDKEN